MQHTLVGKTVRLSSKVKGEKCMRTLFIQSYCYDAGIRYYRVMDEDTKEYFWADANIYDYYFLVNRSKIKRKNHRETIFNKSNPEYKK